METKPTEQTKEYLKTIQTLTERGFRPVYSNPEFSVFSKPKFSSCIFVAQVTKDGKVNTLTLSEFLTEVLDDPQPSND